MKLPEVDGRNFQKVLRELDIDKFPSMPDFLKGIHTKLNNKVKLSESEELLTKNKLIKYFKDYTYEYNRSLIEEFDWNLFSKRPPFEFQKIGVKFLILNDKCILADDMGLGKSIQSVMATKLLPDSYKVLIVTLRTLKYNFQEEVNYFDDRTTVIEKKWDTNKYTLIHYESVKKFHKEIAEAGFDVIIMDECHKIKNPKAKRTELFLDIFKKTKKEIKKVWLLTGTPLDNRPSEFYNLLKIIKHPITKNWIHYIERYCAGYKDQYNHWITSGSSNLEELFEQTKGSILRRTKKQVLNDFPDKTRTTIPIKLENIKGYDKSLQEFIDRKFILELKEEKEEEEVINTIDDLTKDFFGINGKKKRKPSDLEKITQLQIYRQWCALEKVKDGSTIELIENEIDKRNKIIVFTNFTAVIDQLKNKLGDICITLDGRIKEVEERQAIVNKFNSDTSLKVFIVNFAVGATGLNLQSSNVIIMNDLPWVPSLILQGEDRIYRIGQTRDCRILYPYFKGTVEETIFKVIIAKVDMISKVLDGVSSEFIDDHALTEKIEVTANDVLADILKELGNFNLN